MSKYLVLFLISFSVQAQIGSPKTVTDTDKLDSSRFSIIEILKDLEAQTTGAWIVPSGTDAQRPSPAQGGMLRYNSEQGTFEGYTTEWGPIAGGGSLTSELNQDLPLIIDGTGDLVTELDTRTYNLDPQIQHGNLIPNASFERDDVSFITCTNATASTEASELGGQGNQRQLTITSSGTSWSCDIVGAASEGQGVLTLSARASVTGINLCALVNSTETFCDDIRVSSEMNSYAYPYSLGDTANSIRIKGATSGDVVKIDMVDLKQGNLSELVYQNEATINASGSGDFTAGSLKVSRIGNSVTLTVLVNITFPSASRGASASGFLPTWARPEAFRANLYSFQSGTRQRYIEINPNGSLAFEFSDGSSIADSGVTASITYTVSDSQSSTAFTRNCIGFECVNEFSARVSDSGVVTGENVDWINGSCSTSGGDRTCSFNSGVFDAAPNCVATPFENGTAQATVKITAVSSSSITINGRADGNVDTAYIFYIQCQRSTDYKKQLSITGTLKGYYRSQVEKNLRVCTIAQVNETTTGSYVDYDNCLSSASRSSTGVHSVTLNSGTFKAGTEFYCLASGGRASPSSSQPPIVSAFDGTSGGVLIDAGNNIRVTSEFAGVGLSDAPWVIECKGEASY